MSEGLYIPPDITSSGAAAAASSSSSHNHLASAAQILLSSLPQSNSQPPHSLTASEISTNNNNNVPSNHQQNHYERSTEEGGGRLWKLAGEQVSTFKQSRWAETFLAGTKSCADPNATTTATATTTTTTDPATAPTTTANTTSTTKIAATTISPSTYGISSTSKPRDITPLLIMGVVGILVGWLGNAVVGTSCHFAAINVSVGQSELALHMGLYKYSTVDSALNGYQECFPYGGSYSNDAPYLSRTMNVVALVFGSCCLVVIWWTLVAGSGSTSSDSSTCSTTSDGYLRIWIWSGRAALLAGIFQLATFLFYFEKLCQQHECVLGPASYLNVITAAVWFGMARMMCWHPWEWGVVAIHQDDSTLLEMRPVISASTIPSYEPPTIC